MKLKMIGLMGTLLLLAGCSQPVPEEKPLPKPEVETVELRELSNDRWTYFSFEKGEIVGQSIFGDEKGDREWKERMDWDVAFCGDHIRTNGGTSGNGSGALQKMNGMSFNAIEEAPSDGYVEDTGDIVVRK